MEAGFFALGFFVAARFAATRFSVRGRGAGSQGEFEEYFVEVLWSAPADPNKAVKGQRAGHLLCRNPDDDAGFAVLTRSGKRWVWRTGSLDEVLALLPAELAAAARETLDEPPTA